MAKKTTKGIAVATAVAAALTGLLSRSADRQPGQSLRAFDYGPVVETVETLEPTYHFNGVDSTAYPVALVKATLLPHRAEGFTIKPKGRDAWSKPQTLINIVRLLDRKLAVARLGQVWWVRSVADGYREPALRYDANPTAFMDTPGTHGVDLVVGTVVQHFPQVQNLGITACKIISGSSPPTYSQHSWSNAVDLGGPGVWGSPSYVAYLDDIVDFLYEMWDEGQLPIAQIGWRNWPNHYPGHAHISIDPMFHGIPECA